MKIRLAKIHLPKLWERQHTTLGLPFDGLDSSISISDQFYIYPDLVVTGSAARPNTFGTFIVAKHGNAAATKVEVGFIAALGQTLRLIPAIGARVVEEDSGFVKTLRVEVERPLPGESFSVTILAPRDAPMQKQRHKTELVQKWELFLPSVTFVRSAEGVGRFVRLEGDDPDWKGSLGKRPRR